MWASEPQAPAGPRTAARTALLTTESPFPVPFLFLLHLLIPITDDFNPNHLTGGGTDTCEGCKSSQPSLQQRKLSCYRERGDEGSLLGLLLALPCPALVRCGCTWTLWGSGVFLCPTASSGGAATTPLLSAEPFPCESVKRGPSLAAATVGSVANSVVLQQEDRVFY